MLSVKKKKHMFNIFLYFSSMFLVTGVITRFQHHKPGPQDEEGFAQTDRYRRIQ